jgi:hypothetical protein
LPDVIVDLRNVQIKQLEKDRVLVTGAYKCIQSPQITKGVRGRQPTPFLKVSGIYMDGYKVTGEMFVGGLEARDKAKAVGESILTRVRGMLQNFGMDDFRGTNVEVLGSEWTYG